MSACACVLVRAHACLCVLVCVRACACLGTFTDNWQWVSAISIFSAMTGIRSLSPPILHNTNTNCVRSHISMRQFRHRARRVRAHALVLRRLCCSPRRRNLRQHPSKSSKQCAGDYAARG
eukprot:6203986-Pleurochrysis_carterae.AAC.3